MAKSGSLAVVDQALFAGTNFLVNILLVHWSSASEYGAFAIAQSVFFLLAAFHSNVLIEPMMVLGPDKYASAANRYLGSLLYFHAGSTLAAGALLATIATAFWAQHFAGPGDAFAGLAVATPLILLLWLSRRALYLRAQYPRAVAGGGLYLLLSLAGMYGLRRVGLVSSMAVLWILGGAGLLVALWFLRNLRPELHPRVVESFARPVLKDHWRFGKWLLTTSAISWSFNNAVLALLAGSVGLQTAGVFRAYQYLMMPLFHGLAALDLVVTPWISRRFPRLGLPGLHRVTGAFTLLAVAISSVYVILLYAFRVPVVEVVLGRQYLSHAELLGVWILAPVILAFGQGTHVAVRITQRTSLVLYSYIVGVGFAIAGYLILVPRLGLGGAVWAVILSVAARTITLLALYRGIITTGRAWGGSS